ncbi:ABC transporter substrate-binding protein [Aestuariispira insulae]|nr:ABC transporter substrate-binding protein [Aestuariispira insulae]
MRKILLAFAASLASLPVAAETVSLNNCGRDIHFDAAPEKVVSIGQAATEILYALDLGDKVAGTSVWFTDILPEFKAVNDRVERMADNDPSFEAVVAKRPQLVASQYEWYVGPKGTVGTRPQFHELGIQTYILPTDCVGKDNATGGDGTRNAAFHTGLIHQGIQELAQIFGIEEKGERLVADLQQREAAALAKVETLNLRGLSAVFWFSSPAKIDADPYVAGGKGAPAYIMDRLNIRNVVDTDEEWPTVGWESIARANPSVIVIARMERRRFPADDYRKKLEFLKSDPVTSQMDAVKHDRIIIMDAHAMDPTIRTIGAIETLAEKLRSFGLTG